VNETKSEPSLPKSTEKPVASPSNLEAVRWCEENRFFCEQISKEADNCAETTTYFSTEELLFGVAWQVKKGGMLMSVPKKLQDAVVDHSIGLVGHEYWRR
jgi:hypothetical protein